MKSATPALAALINTDVFVQYDVYTITLAGGGQLLFTAADVDISFAGATWSSKGVRVDNDNSKAVGHWKTGLDVDTWQIAIAPRSRGTFTGASFPDTIGSVPWLAAATQGALDAADVLVQRAYFPALSYPIPPTGAVPTGLLTVFRGQVAEVDCNTSMAILTVNSYLQLLTVQMPRNLYQAGCRHVLFDTQCGLSAAAFAATGTVGANSSRATIVASVAAPGGSGTYTLGRIVVTSGLNAGFARTIAQWDGAQTFTLQSPLPFAVALGDAFTIYPGCDKQLATCQAFGNSLNFGGDPFIPIPETTSS